MITRTRIDLGDAGVFFLMPGEKLARPPEYVPATLIRGLTAGRALKTIGGLPQALGGGSLRNRLGRVNPLVASKPATEGTEAAFDAVFCRDWSQMARALPKWPGLERSFVSYFASYVGRTYDPNSHEEPGKLPHEIRNEDTPRRRELEAKGMTFPDFGTVDGSVLFVLAFANQTKLDPGFANETATHYRDKSEWTHLQSVTETLKLIDRWRESNPQGIIEAGPYAGFFDSFPFWKDNPDAYSHRDGRLASQRASSIEVMAYAFNAYKSCAELAQLHPEFGWNAGDLLQKAQETKQSILNHFIVDDDRGLFVALGTDRDPRNNNVRKLDVRTSNMGLLLGADFMNDPEMKEIREAVVEQLFGPQLLVPGGILSLASDEMWFTPNGYHTGSTWPKDTFEIAQHLAPNYPRLAEALCRIVINDCKEFMPESLPGTNDTSIFPNEWDVWVNMTNALGKDIERRKSRVSERFQGWSATAAMGAKYLLTDLARVPDGGGDAENAWFESKMLGRLAMRDEFFSHLVTPGKTTGL